MATIDDHDNPLAWLLQMIVLETNEQRKESLRLLLDAGRLQTNQHAGRASQIKCREYIPFFNDLQAHKEMWFHWMRMNPVMAITCANVLSFMLHAHEVRGEVRRCLAALEVNEQVLDIMSQHVVYHPKMKEPLTTLTAQHHLVSHGVYLETRDERIVRSYRWLLDYEVDGPNHFYRKLPGIKNQDLNYYRRVREHLRHMKDSEVFAMYVKGLDEDKNKHDIRVCSWCLKREGKYADHKMCARCFEPIYCSKECQTIDWKTQHKLICTAPPAQKKNAK